MADLEKYVGDEMYETVTTYEDGQSFVRDVPTGTLYFKKILSVYNISVFQYLKNRADPHIPEIHDFWKDGDSLVVIAKLIQGHTLEETLGDDVLYAFAEDNPGGAQIIGNTYTVEACDGDGNKIGTKTGVFEEQ